ncbi:hypothetical protein Tco_0800736 [Tanacetum coccineum]|uniref:Uncharacterized protein n=1 Tax=Tanacetum coccineum TaxID=301880 RepID=A0ABQ4ZY92_9ASTR
MSAAELSLPPSTVTALKNPKDQTSFSVCHDAEEQKQLYSQHKKARIWRLDELEFDDLYNNLKVYEHELKGVSNSSSQNIAFLSTEIKGSTLKQSTADPENIPKGYTQAVSSKVQTVPNCASHSDEIIYNNEEIDWTKEFDVEPVTFAMMALTELEEDD